MSFEIKWCGLDKYDKTRYWGYLIDRSQDEEEWYHPYYAFWGNIKSEIVQFKRIFVIQKFYKNIVKKKRLYNNQVDIVDKITLEFEQQKIIRKLKQGG